MKSYTDFFLIYGYFPKKTTYQIDFPKGNYDYSQKTIDELAKTAANLFISDIGEKYKAGEKHLVPLSGGLDSRAILVALLQFSDAKDIYAYSYGPKGSLDFEIGQFIAKEFGVNHISFELQDYKYTLSDLLYHSKSVQLQTVLFHNPPTKQIDAMFGDFTVWSGIVGDVVGGTAVPATSSSSLNDAKMKYLDSKKYIKFNLAVNVDDYLELLDIDGINNRSKLTYNEAVVFTERYEKFYKPVIACGNNKFQEPFINNDFFSFMINAPYKYRKNSKLYHSMLYYLNKDAFSLPTKNKLGLGLFANDYHLYCRRVMYKISYELGLRNVAIGTNYQNFYYKYKSQSYFKKLIDSQLSDLKDRKVVELFDIDKVVKQFKKNSLDVELIKTLVSLEVHLKNGKAFP